MGGLMRYFYTLNVLLLVRWVSFFLGKQICHVTYHKTYSSPIMNKDTVLGKPFPFCTISCWNTWMPVKISSCCDTFNKDLLSFVGCRSLSCFCLWSYLSFSRSSLFYVASSAWLSFDCNLREGRNQIIHKCHSARIPQHNKRTKWKFKHELHVKILE